jgi:predicted DNA-binding protein
MRASATRRHRPKRFTASLLLKLNAEAHAKLETLCTAASRLPIHVLRQVISWGLQQDRQWRVDRRQVRNPAQKIGLRLEPEVRTRVHAAARAAGGEASTWTCHLLQHVTLTDLPTHWQTGEPDPHAHDSRFYDQRYMLRLNAPTRQKLDALAEHCGKSIAEIVRHLVTQATPEDFPQDWWTTDGRRRAALTRRSPP